MYFSLDKCASLQEAAYLYKFVVYAVEVANLQGSLATEVLSNSDGSFSL